MTRKTRALRLVWDATRPHSRGLGRDVKIGPQSLAADPGRLLDIKDALSRNTVLSPSGDGRLVDIKPSGKMSEPDAALPKKRMKVDSHAGDSCSTHNRSQAPLLRSAITTPKGARGYVRNMPAVETIHRSKQPRRPHYIREWAERRNLRPTDLAQELGADKSVVSRWFKGGSPGEDYQNRLAALFGVDREALFRHPDDDWFARFFAGRRADEIEAMKRTLEAAFPRKRA